MNKRIKREVETGCEYSFPDYMGDIKKILSCRARCRDIGRLTADGALEVNGVVEYEVLYADSENKLTAMSTSSDYTVSAPINEDTYCGSSVEGRVTGFTMRVTGPRKLSLRAMVENDVILTHNAAMSVMGDALDGEKVSETNTRVIKIEDFIYGEALEREYAEEAERLSGLAGEDVEIIAAGGDVRINEAVANDGGAELRGDLVLYAIVKIPNEPPFRISKVIPISEAVEIGGATKDMPIIPRAEATSVTFGLNDDGDDKVIVANAIISLSANAVINEDVEVITDAYLIDWETKAKYSDLEYETLSEIKRDVIELSERVPLVGISPERIRGVVSAAADIADVRATAVGKCAKISGKITLALIACEINDDDSFGYIPIKHSFEFEENVNLSCQIADNSVLRCALSSPSVDALIDGGEITVGCSFSASVSVNSEAVVNVLDSLDVICELDSASGASVSVYYPTEGDTLFLVAKRYHKSLAAVAEVNALADSVSLSEAKGSPIGKGKLFII